MPERDWNEVCSEAVSSVLETMFFTSPMGLSESPVEGEAMEARVLFRGAPSGEFRLRIAQSGARLVASGFLGTEEEALSQPQTEQVVCELANMLCGFFVSRLESEQKFDLATPELLDAAAVAEEWQGIAEAQQSFELESGILSIALRLEAAG